MEDDLKKNGGRPHKKNRNKDDLEQKMKTTSKKKEDELK